MLRAAGTPFAYDTNGNVIGIYNPSGAIVPLTPAPYTWAGMPAASASNAGVPIRVSNVGTSAAGSIWMSDGTVWRPVNGRLLLASGIGSVGTPFATYSGTGAQFPLPGGNPSFPAGLFAHNAEVTIDAMVRRTGTNSSATFSARLGTGGTTGDSTINAQNIVNNNPNDFWMYSKAAFPVSTTMTTSQWLPPGVIAGVSAFADKTTNVNTASVNYLSFDIYGSNAGDTYELIAYNFWLEM
jgi:hypothetical protein